MLELTRRRMSDIQLRHGPPTSPTLRSLLFAPGSDERKLAQGARVRGGRRRRRPRGRGRARREGRGARARRDVFAAPRGAAAARPRQRRRHARGSPTTWRAVAELALDAIVLPKATPEAVDALGASGPPVIAIVETAQGAPPRLRDRVAAARRRAADRRGRPRRRARARAAAGRARDPATPARSVVARLGRRRAPAAVRRRPPRRRGRRRASRQECRLARSLGFRGKACIHPAQVPIVEPRLRAERARRSPGRGGCVDGVRAAAARRPRRGRARRRDDRPAGRRAGAAAARGSERR